MISKKKLKERLLDICAGAGMEWELDYFEYRDLQGECIGNAIIAIEKRFNLGAESRLRAPCRLKDYEDIDTMVELVLEAIEYD